jgi:hypothetical protein
MVYGSLPDGFQSPYSTSVMDVPASVPCKPAQSTCIGCEVRAYVFSELRKAYSGDVRMLDPGFHNQWANTIHNNDCIVILCSNRQNQVVSAMPSCQVLPLQTSVISFKSRTSRQREDSLTYLLHCRQR